MIATLVLSLGLAGCGSPRAAVPTQPTLVQQPIPGAKIVNGIVSDTAFRVLGHAIVEVLDGPQTGLQAATNERGEFSLTGVFDDSTRFRASGDGVLPAISTWSLPCATCGHWLYFKLGIAAPPASIAGAYDVTFTASAGCTDLPDPLRVRTYAATVVPLATPSDPEGHWLYEARMSGAPFVDNYKSFRIGVAGDYLGFPDSEGAVLVEELAPNTYVSYNAFGWDGNRIVGAVAGSTITTTFLSVDYCVMTSPFGSEYWCDPANALAHVECLGTNRLTMTRR